MKDGYLVSLRSWQPRTIANPNPPIKGHKLLHEGRYVRRINPVTDEYDGWEGGCECGAEPEGHDTDPINAVKRWHRQHKAQIRGEVAS